MASVQLRDLSPDAVNALKAELMAELMARAEDIATVAASKALAAFPRSDGAQVMSPATPPTQLGPVEAGTQVSVDWELTNSSPAAWPSGTRLVFIDGDLQPPPGFTPWQTNHPILCGASVTANARLLVPHRGGPCESRWMIQASDDTPLSDHFRVLASVPDDQSGSVATPQPKHKGYLGHSAGAAPAQNATMLPAYKAPQASTNMDLRQNHPASTNMDLRQNHPASTNMELSQTPPSANTALRQRATPSWMQCFESFIGAELAQNIKQNTKDDKYQADLTQKVTNKVFPKVKSSIHDGVMHLDAEMRELFSPLNVGNSIQSSQFLVHLRECIQIYQQQSSI